MTAEDNKQLVLKSWSAYVDGDTAGALAGMADDVSFTMMADLPGIKRVNEGKSFLTELSKNRPQMFPNGVTFAIKSAVSEADTVVLEYTLKALTAKNRQYDNSYCVFFRVKKGKIAEIREYCDTNHIMKVMFE